MGTLPVDVVAAGAGCCDSFEGASNAASAYRCTCIHHRGQSPHTNRCFWDIGVTHVKSLQLWSFCKFVSEKGLKKMW